MNFDFSDRQRPPVRTIRYVRIDLFVVSTLLIFLELICIRWITSTVRLMAYFSNVVMLSCFLGMGLGCLRKKGPRFIEFLPFLLAVFLPLCVRIGSLEIGNPFASAEYVWGAGTHLGRLWVVPFIYAYVILLFVCVGQSIGRLMDELPPLEAYSINIGGSLAGVLLATILAFLKTPPAVWFTCIALFIIWQIRAWTRVVVFGVLCLAMSIVVIGRQQRHNLWSPYYKIEMDYLPAGAHGSFWLSVNTDYHQSALNLADRWSEHLNDFRAWRAVYDLPYRVLGRPPEDVLVLGAGTGNDVRAGLRNGAQHITAVELDPLILQLGRSFHPEHPYADPRVIVVVNDARFFLRMGQIPFDLIVMGWLDSHRLFSSLSNIRQDNFLYTRESFQQVQALLKPNGLLVLSFYCKKPWIDAKLFGLIQETFGHAPRVFAYPGGAYGSEGHLFVVAKDPAFQFSPTGHGFIELTDQITQATPNEVPSDDWPYLYYKGRFLSKEYSFALGLLATLSCLLVFLQLRGTRFKGPSLLFFALFGAGFMLLETRNITTLALAYGSTWLINSIVITGVMLMTLSANLLAAKKVLPSEHWLWVFLAMSLLLTYLVRENVLPGGPAMRGILLSVVVSVTFFFSAGLFAVYFDRTPMPSQAIGANVLGAVLGGFSEYGTLIIGLRNLILIVAACYATAWLLARSGRLPEASFSRKN